MKALLIVLLLALGLLVLVDRVGVTVAEGQVADQVAERGGLASAPDVDITGFPFLTQALSGRYDEVRISLTAEQLGEPAGTRADVSLFGVQVPLSDAVSGSVQEIPVEQVDGTATISYVLLAQQLGGDTRLRPDGDRLRIDRTVDLLGLEVPVTARGTVSLDGQDLVVDVDDAAAAGVDVPGFVLDGAADVLDFRYPVPELPFGLELTGVDPRDDGVLVQVSATDTVLSG
ncbi:MULTISPECIES: LmeA family phospholipid-binding protein [unclassified Modestobacter]|uniref:LmeA family phospholipid-binding protein n=1 Tax=unclassified Modestobacter TaxID=2643866 RepID=UPI0022AA9907|nr:MULTISPECIES: DUF2993 domain-containing protein [unclassified Modestobacter]MCZ2823497.1 DUF2993 domain-containing protein [Modestobacter sp. VKM Ac-2981]MCZ2851742.1 DUF2993 domain-containing protein [Modestobacter sp. VKM Ac-2982]